MNEQEHAKKIKKQYHLMNLATDNTLTGIWLALKDDPEEPYKTLLLNLESAIEKIKALESVIIDNFDACNKYLDEMYSEDEKTPQYEANQGVSYKHMLEHLVPGRSSWL